MPERICRALVPGPLASTGACGASSRAGSATHLQCVSIGVKGGDVACPLSPVDQWLS